MTRRGRRGGQRQYPEHEVIETRRTGVLAMRSHDNPAAIVKNRYCFDVVPGTPGEGQPSRPRAVSTEGQVGSAIRLP